MGFLEFMFFFGVFTYAVRHNFWLDAPWINKVDHSHVTEVKPTEQQNKVLDAWVRGVTHDQNKAA
ncbi:hypothetical protein [Loigolactobacillus binensis]|uniref:Uncharacterized protein n=1 Tax=Loigolactobacillus binensis TaxID=2559922 RepID=A0ABW3EDD8_9LACO|nr:hypothetical protein [Loigolactobacillus binensis]